MFGLPASTEIRKTISKTVIYEKFASEIAAPRRKSFDKEISRITVTNEISPASVNICEGKEVRSIFALVVELKGKDYDEKNIALITRLFGQKLLIILRYEEDYQLAIYHTKIFHSGWTTENGIKLILDGLNLDIIWQNLVIQISGIVPSKGHTLDEQITIEEEKENLRKEIDRLEAQIRREPQAKKKFALHEMILEYKKKLEEN